MTLNRFEELGLTSRLVERTAVYNVIRNSMPGPRTKELPEFPAYMCDFPDGGRNCEFPQS
jgi:hypothetical protein